MFWSCGGNGTVGADVMAGPESGFSNEEPTLRWLLEPGFTDAQPVNARSVSINGNKTFIDFPFKRGYAMYGIQFRCTRGNYVPPLAAEGASVV